MAESETEDEILARIETALQKIAAAGTAGRPAGAIDRATVARSLDMMIDRLRGALEPPPHAEMPPASDPGTE